MAYPHVHMLLVKVGHELQDILVRLHSELSVLLRVDMLDVQHDQVRQRHQFVVFRHQRSVLRIEGDAGAVDTGMDSSFLGQGEQVDQEIHLHQRLTAGDGQAAAVGVERLVLLVLLDDVGRFHESAAVQVPGIRIVAVGTAHGTALHEYHEARAGSVDGSKAFQ